MNQVEIWFNRITQQAIRRGTFQSVKELVARIDQFVRSSNTGARPFIWTATADSILAKIERLCNRISGTAHQQPLIVLVSGHVYNSGAMTYVPGKNAGLCLSKAGGATQLAEKGAVFIVRADGEVISFHQGGRFVRERTLDSGSPWRHRWKKNFIALAQIAEVGAIMAAVIP